MNFLQNPNFFLKEDHLRITVPKFGRTETVLLFTEEGYDFRYIPGVWTRGSSWNNDRLSVTVL